MRGIGLKLFTALSAWGGVPEDNRGRRYLWRDLNPTSAECEADVVRTPTRSSFLHTLLLAM